MLETLKIKNLAVIDSVEVPFEPGLNILSGETGAGKSIVIEAISLILGSRATSDLIRAGNDEAIVEGVFSTKELPWLETRLTDAGFGVEDHTLLIRRSISPFRPLCHIGLTTPRRGDAVDARYRRRSPRGYDLYQDSLIRTDAPKFAARGT